MRQGFTLIELIVVVVIVSILVTLLTANYVGAVAKGRDAQRMNDLKQIQTALESYYNDNGNYPPLSWVCSNNSAFVTNPWWIAGLGPQHIKQMPRDPKNTPSCFPRDTATCYSYCYFSSTWAGEFGPTGGQAYILYTRLERYPKNDLSQKPYYEVDGTFFSHWSEGAVNGLFVLRNP